MTRDPIDECNQRLQAAMANVYLISDAFRDGEPLAALEECRQACEDLDQDLAALTAEIKGRLTEAWVLYERFTDALERAAQGNGTNR